ncbi:MAG: hypothetical protein KDA21_03450 [Phycisphaerales bacterium]|nr:hypothetical protein [Phycisphaerales bacterium]
MTAIGRRYGYAPYDEDEEIPMRDLHPHVRREAQRIARRSTLSRLRQWWLSSVGVIAVAAMIVATVATHTLNLITMLAALAVATVATLYLLSVALSSGSE